VFDGRNAEQGNQKMTDNTKRLPTSPNGADLLVDVLNQEGVEYIFGNPGTTEMPVIHALSRQPDLRYVLGLQETAVVAMADGYAQASGKPAVVNLHTAGGLGHAMGALLHSYTARTPLLVTAGQQDTRHSFADPLLYGNILKMAEPAVKWAREIAHPDHIPALVRRGLQESLAEPKGPTFLSLPIDVLTRPTTAKAGQGSSINRDAVAGGLEELASALAAVAPGRLAVIAGDEVTAADAMGELVRVVDLLGATVHGPSWPNSMSFPTTHPLWSGNLPSSATDMRSVLADYDVVFVAGANPFISYLYSEGPAIPDGCRLFQVSQDAAEIGRTYAADIGCVGNLKATLQSMLPILSARAVDRRDAVTSIRTQAEASRRARLRNLELSLSENMSRIPISPLAAAGEVLSAIGRDVAIVDEAPATMYHVRAFLERGEVRRYFFMRSAILGWGLPAAIGVSLGLNRAPVVALLGDGSSLYSPQALWTAAKLRTPVTFVIMNNAEYNILKRYSAAQGYRADGANSMPGMEINDPLIDFRALATTFGIRWRHASRADEIRSQVSEAISSSEPNLVEIAIGAMD
jgi:benzoylformate decarboxylase